MNTIWNVITNYGICWITPQQYQHQEDELAFTEGKL